MKTLISSGPNHAVYVDPERPYVVILRIGPSARASIIPTPQVHLEIPLDIWRDIQQPTVTRDHWPDTTE